VGTPPPPNRAPLLRPVDALALLFISALLVCACVAWYRGVPRGREAVENLVMGVAMLFAMRASPRLVQNKLTSFLAAQAPLAMVPIDWSLDPVVDLIHPALTDSTLLSIDRWLFGETPSVLLERVLTPWLTEALLIGYLSYFALLALPLVLLWFFADQEAHEEYARAIVLLFVLNLSFYILVPAIGPRFQLADTYAQPLHGLLFGDAIRDLFTRVPFFRDCFPSGHTAGTLMALVFARRRFPRFFWVMLPFGSLCIMATVLCRFHYAIDLICALPLFWFALSASRSLSAEALFGRMRTVID
jgi:hypothetical protein